MQNTEKQFTIKEWADIWLPVYVAPNCRESTLESYSDCRRRMTSCYPHFEETLLSELLPYQFQSCLNDMADKYAKSTISHIRSVYKQLYDRAVQNHLCSWNPIEDVKTPETAATKEVPALTQEEERLFLEAASSLPTVDYFILLTYLYTGMRRNELRDLRWSHWDREKNVLHVTRSKTEKGVREIPVIPEVGFILSCLDAKDHRRDGYIFTINEEQIKKCHLRWICKKTARNAGIQHVHPHMLRHTFATRMVEKKVDPSSLSEILGHKSVVFTLKTYVDVDKKVHLREEMMKISSFDTRESVSA